ncbi:disease resistance protein Roq1 isoform X2 [Cryptomeria japonica]|uniref:disease resistance protein Roq1 isoform X2 n=1 Tax=Cryptomeria japonica TaxID=3369 RepID=UPI0027DA40FE|nr:disease resistance protein Roq1 isoform X2 [Cryptomeria japonica]
MDRNHGRQLFCWHAFDHPIPSAGYEALVEQFVDVCGGLPLSLLVLGRLVHGRDHRFWELKLNKARETLPRDVKQRLRLSFDALEDEEKQVFIDIACFYLGKPTCMAERICGSSGWDAQNALQTLKDKCLLEEEEAKIWDEIGYGSSQLKIVLRMHDHLRDLGREMAGELSSPRRLWHPRDLESLELMGLQAILAETNVRCFHSFSDDAMGCGVTFFLGQSDSCVDTSASLLWVELAYNFNILSWVGRQILQHENDITERHLQNLQYLKICGGRFKTLWENPRQHQLSTSWRDLHGVSGSADPLKLRELIIRQCPELEEVPSLARLSCMEKIEIDSCDKLQNITLPTALITLSVQRCTYLQRVVGSSDLIKLTELIITGCPELEEVPSLSRLSCMEKIHIDFCDKLQNITLPTTLITLCKE